MSLRRISVIVVALASILLFISLLLNVKKTYTEAEPMKHELSDRRVQEAQALNIISYACYYAIKTAGDTIPQSDRRRQFINSLTQIVMRNIEIRKVAEQRELQKKDMENILKALSNCDIVFPEHRSIVAPIGEAIMKLDNGLEK